MNLSRSLARLQHLLVIAIALLAAAIRSPTLPLSDAHSTPKTIGAPHALTRQPPSDDSWYAQAMDRLRSSDDFAAVDALHMRGNQHPTSPMAAPALLEAGEQYEQLNRLADARLVYRAVVDRYPSSVEAPTARFRLGFLAYLQGDFSEAATTWSVPAGSGQFAGRVAFWLGKARSHLADAAGARAAWESAVRLDPNGFYSLRANDFLHGHPDAIMDPHSLDVPPAGTTPANQQLDAWYHRLGTDAATVQMAVQADPGYQHVLQLARQQDRAQASRELDGLAQRYTGDVVHLSALASLLAEAGEVSYATQLAQRTVEAANAASLTVPVALERLAYPLPYQDQILPLAQQQGVDPLLFMALLRQESSFDASARSPAGAYGLAQIMPSTGQAIAERMGRTDWQPDELFQPEVNIEFGLIILADQLAAYHGRLFPALAAYNAGAGAVASWRAARGADDADVFVELIPYPETRGYVQQVYANYVQYERLYRGGTPMSSDQTK